MTMDIFLSTSNTLLNLVVTNPVCSAVGAFFGLLGVLHLYFRLTVGLCRCNQDMTGKTVLITGASAGVGKAAAYELARRNARVLLACRNLQKAQKVADEIQLTTGNNDVHVKFLDLCSFESVRKCAQNVLETEEKLHILINNAGIIGIPRQLTEDGCEKIMQSNHLGHFLLTLLLLDLLKKSTPSRIINVASTAHSVSKLDLDDMTNEKNLSWFSVYANSKQANVLFTKELSTRLSGTGITVNALCPGLVKTEIFKNLNLLLTVLFHLHILLRGKTAEEGAQTVIHLAVAPDLEKTTGKYFTDCKETATSSKANDENMAKRLFEISEKIVGVSFASL